MRAIIIFGTGFIVAVLFLGILKVNGVDMLDKISSSLSETESYPAPGEIPDFSKIPQSGDLFEYIDSDWTLINQSDSSEILFRDLKGKVIFLNRWATWCAPCIAEMPEIAQLKNNLPEDIKILLVSDEQERIVASFKNEYNLPLYISKGKIPELLRGRGLPATFIIDRSGLLKYEHSGMALWGDKAVVDFISGLESNS